MHSSHLRGVILATGATVLVSPDVLIMLIVAEKTDSSIFLMLLYKSVFKSFLVSCFLTSTTSTCKSILRPCLEVPYLFAAGVIASGLFEIMFTVMILTTTVARAMLFYSLNPFWSALIGRFCLGDALEYRTIVALFLSVGSVCVILIPTMLGLQTEERASETGGMLAVVCGFALSAWVCIVRYVGKKDSGLNMMPALLGGCVLAAIFTVLAMILLSQKMVVSDEHSLLFFYTLMGIDALFVTLALVVITLAPRYIITAEVSLITLLETPLSPCWVFLWYDETPGRWTLVGGSLLIATLLIHEFVGMVSRLALEEGATKPVQSASREDKVTAGA